MSKTELGSKSRVEEIMNKRRGLQEERNSIDAHLALLEAEAAKLLLQEGWIGLVTVKWGPLRASMMKRRYGD